MRGRWKKSEMRSLFMRRRWWKLRPYSRLRS